MVSTHLRLRMYYCVLKGVYYLFWKTICCITIPSYMCIWIVSFSNMVCVLVISLKIEGWVWLCFCYCLFCFVSLSFELPNYFSFEMKSRSGVDWVHSCKVYFSSVYIITYCLWGRTIRVLLRYWTELTAFFFFFFILCIYFYYYYKSRLLNPCCLRPRVYDVFVCLSNWMFVGLFCLEL